MHFDYTKDVMDMMTEFRKAWKFTYPEEEQFAEIKKAYRYQLIISDIYVLLFVSQTYKNDTKEIIKFLIQIQELHNC